MDSVHLKVALTEEWSFIVNLSHVLVNEVG